MVWDAILLMLRDAGSRPHVTQQPRGVSYHPCGGVATEAIEPGPSESLWMDNRRTAILHIVEQVEDEIVLLRQRAALLMDKAQTKLAHAGRLEVKRRALLMEIGE